MPAMKRALATILALGALGGCAEGDRIVYFGLAGEAPTYKPAFEGEGGAERLGRRAPAIPEGRFRPAVLPETGEGALFDAATRARQVYSDRDDEYAFRRRALRVNVLEYETAAAAIRPVPGEPPPTKDARFDARMAAAREALARIEADIVSIHGITIRTERSVVAHGALVAQARRQRGDLPEAIAKAAAATAETARRLQADGQALAGAYLDWMSREREAADAAERLAAARGAESVPGRTLIRP
jgi:hypothetical protein